MSEELYYIQGEKNPGLSMFGQNFLNFLALRKKQNVIKNINYFWNIEKKNLRNQKHR